MCFYSYRLVYEDEEGKESTCRGITPASNYVEAMEHLDNMYGEDHIVEILNLKLIAWNWSALEFTEETLSQIEKEVKEMEC